MRREETLEEEEEQKEGESGAHVLDLAKQTSTSWKNFPMKFIRLISLESLNSVGIKTLVCLFENPTSST